MNKRTAALVFALIAAVAGFASAIEDESRDFDTTPPPRLELPKTYTAPPNAREATPESAAAETPPATPAATPAPPVAESAATPASAPTASAPESVAPPADAPASTPPVPEYFKAHQAIWDQPAAADVLGEPAQPLVPREGASQRSSLVDYALRTLAVLLVLCGLIVLGGWGARKYGGRAALLSGQNLGQVLGKVYLGPRASLLYVKTGGRVLVLGVTPQSIHPVTEFEDNVFEVPAKGPVAETASFLARLQERPPLNPIREDEEITSLRGDIQRLKDFLRESKRDAAE